MGPDQVAIERERWMQSSNTSRPQEAGLPSAKLLSVIVPVHNSAAQITVRVEALLDILSDARLPFEFLMLDFASTDSTSEMLVELSRMYPQIRSVTQASNDVQEAVSLAIRQAAGDMIVVLDEGPYAVVQLRQLLQEAIEDSHPDSMAHEHAHDHFDSHGHFGSSTPLESQRSRPAAHSDTNNFIDSNEVPLALESDSDEFDFSGRRAERLEMPTVPEVSGLENRLLQRLEQWAAALRRESAGSGSEAIAARGTGQSNPMNEIPQTRPSERERHDEIIRVDDQGEDLPKRKIPKFITRFHEFI